MKTDKLNDLAGVADSLAALQVPVSSFTRIAAGIASSVVIVIQDPPFFDQILGDSRVRRQFSEQLGDIISKESGPTGRRIEFLLQEMVREVNTIGSKTLDLEIAHPVIELKTEIERMREQAHNIL